jgi:hypothetical protein
MVSGHGTHIVRFVRFRHGPRTVFGNQAFPSRKLRGYRGTFPNFNREHQTSTIHTLTNSIRLGRHRNAFRLKKDFQNYGREDPDVALGLLAVVGSRPRRLVGIVEELPFTQ